MAMAVAVFGLQTGARACACCAEEGERFESALTLDHHQVSELNALKFARAAKLYTDARGLEAVRGIEPVAEKYTLDASRGARRWRLTFRDENNRSGTLAFDLPANAQYFGADWREDAQPKPNGPLLYKELRLRGRVWGNGIFAKGMSGAPQFFLVLQGRGNRCPAVADWRNWRLEIKGAAADFVLFGNIENSGGEKKTALYFSSPEAAIPIITNLLRAENWRVLSRYYDLSGTNIAREELESGRFFLNEKRPTDAHPGVAWKYRHPFAPGYRYSSSEDVAALNVVQVVVSIEIDQGGGMIQRGIDEFLMRRSEAGYQILPPA
jgi:hypothetical protein